MKPSVSELRAEIVKLPCAFVLHILEPVETLRRLAIFIQENGIVVDNMNMHRYRNGEANLVIHCQVERDQLHRTVDLLEKLPGVMELELLK